MKNVLGDNLTLTLFGESHSEYIGGTLDGLTPGIKIDEESILPVPWYALLDTTSFSLKEKEQIFINYF